MFLQILLIISALIVSGCAEFFSIYGLAHTFPFAMNSMIIFGIGIGIAKLCTASFVYRYWTKINLLLKTISIGFMGFLMVLTSIGIFGYLNAAYQSGAIDGKETAQKIEVLTEQKNQYETQISFIDSQIEKSPEKFVSKKIELIKTLQKDRQVIAAKLDEINTERNKLLTSQIGKDAKLGPITFIAKAFGLPVDNAIAYLIGLIMIVFDPLSIFLTILVNIVSKHRKELTISPVTIDTVEPAPASDEMAEQTVIDNIHARKREIIKNSRII